MSCCSEVVDLGCVDHCSSIDTTYDATQAGVHTFEFLVMNNTWQTHDVTFGIGDDIIIPSGLVPEARPIDFKLKQPDGTYYQWDTTDGIECARITTGIYGNIVT